jgi:nucleoside-diphosphate-sugar epimerase|tara:strand:+ start:983 stop:1921 length:939 start_codon:yes stop_codon:yes gene_type:complete
MKVLITGCQGFIAKNLAQHLKKQGHYVVGLDKKLKTGDPVFVDEFNGHNMEETIKIENDFDRVYHLSADVPNSKYMGMAQMATGRSNPIQSVHALDFAAKNKSHFVYPCSAMMYNTDVQGHNGPDLNEDEHIWPAKPERLYGMEKLYNMQLVQEYAKYYDMKVSLPIFHAMYGPYLDIFENSKVVAAMCVKILNATNPGEIEVWGDGTQMRSFCYIDDLMIGLDKLIEHNVQVPVNMGSDECITMTQLADMLIKISGKQITKKYLPSGPAGCMRRNSDNTKIQKLTGWKPNYSLQEGLRKTFEYVKSQLTKK